MTQEISKYVNAEPWYGKIWAKFKQFPGYLAEGSKNPPKVSGSAAAALISAGIGCFAMMVCHHISDADSSKTIEKIVWSWGAWIPGSHNPDEMWGNIGNYSGKETVMLVVWLVSWLFLHFTWKDKNIKGNTIIFWLLTLIVAATAMSWHPLFPYLPLV
jgi:hypothetical protein